MDWDVVNVCGDLFDANYSRSLRAHRFCCRKMLQDTYHASYMMSATMVLVLGNHEVGVPYVNCISQLCFVYHRLCEICVRVASY